MALNHSVKGCVNYAVVGTPTVVNGVVSGFQESGSHYVYASYDGATITSGIELVTKFITGSMGSEHCVFRGQDDLYLCNLFIESDGKLLARIFPEFTYASGVSLDGTTVLSAQTAYWVKIVISSLRAAIYLSTDGVSYTLEKEQAIMAAFPLSLGTNKRNEYGFNSANSALNFDGSIDLNQTYIKVNGQAWFGLCPVEVKHINYGTTVGYDKVGSPTISNGVVSGFSASDYIKTSSVSTGKVSDYEFDTKVTFGAISGGRRYILGYATNNSLCGLQINANYKLSWMSTRWSGSGNVEIISPIDPVEGSTYLINCSYVGNGTFKLRVSNDNGTTWSEATGTLPSDVTEPEFTNGVFIGRSGGGSNAYPFNGSIDLNYTKFKKNGGLWFYKPCTNYLVKDGKLIFADSGLYIDDNGTKTYASANIAPVPSEFTFGNTTTTDVGLVDMTTQVFTAVPGATWGRD